MSQTITLTVPDHVFQPLLRVAQATHQPVEQLLLTALQVSLPPLEGLPDEMRRNLTELELLEDHDLRRVMLETVPVGQAERIHQLLEEQQEATLSEEQAAELDNLQDQADLVMLRKARAAVLLRFRGQPVPTAAELAQLTGPLA